MFTVWGPHQQVAVKSCILTCPRIKLLCHHKNIPFVIHLCENNQPKFSKFFWRVWLGWYHMNPIHLDVLYVDASTWWRRILVSWEFAMSLVWVLKFSLSLLSYSLILGITERHSSTHSIPLTIAQMKFVLRDIWLTSTQTSWAIWA